MAPPIQNVQTQTVQETTMTTVNVVQFYAMTFLDIFVIQTAIRVHRLQLRTMFRIRILAIHAPMDMCQQAAGNVSRAPKVKSLKIPVRVLFRWARMERSQKCVNTFKSKSKHR